MATEDIVVHLKAITGEFQGKMAEASKEFDHLEKQSKGTSDKLAAVGKGLALGIGAVAVGIGAVAVKLADGFEVAHARLQTALENTGSSFDKVGAQVDGLVAKGAKFGLNATDIENALAIMTTGMGSSSKAMANLQLAEDLAAKTGKPLADAALAVTKASEGQLRPLKQLGIDLPVAAGGALKVQKAQDALAKAQTHLVQVQTAIHDGLIKGKPAWFAYEKASDAVKDAEDKLNTAQSTGTTILDGLRQKLGGAAATQADTFGGKVRAVTAELQNLGIKIGLWLIPKIEALITAIQSVVDWFGKHHDAAVALGIIIGTVTTALIAFYVAQKLGAAWAAIVQVATGAWTAAQWLLNVALDSNPIGIFIFALVGLAAALVVMHDKWKVIWTDVQNIFSGVMGVIQGDAIGMVNIVGGALNQLIRVINDIIQGLNDINPFSNIPKISTFGSLGYPGSGSGRHVTPGVPGAPGSPIAGPPSPNTPGLPGSPIAGPPSPSMTPGAPGSPIAGPPAPGAAASAARTASIWTSWIRGAREQFNPGNQFRRGITIPGSGGRPIIIHVAINNPSGNGREIADQFYAAVRTGYRTKELRELIR